MNIYINSLVRCIILSIQSKNKAQLLNFEYE